MLGVMKRYTERERERLVVESESWNGSVADFCRQRGVSAVSLSLWRWRYGARGAGSKDEAGRGAWILVEVHGVGPGVSEVPRYVLVSPAGVRMEVSERFKIEEVRAIWKVITRLPT
jgi:transposase-like protein